MRRFYFDTSIWLDLFEDRNEPNFPKGTWVRNLVNKIIRNNDKIVYSNIVLDELGKLEYSYYETRRLLSTTKKVLQYVQSTPKQFRKAKDLSKKRDIPLLDALHALIARDNKALMITRDAHFKKLKDIVECKKPEDVI